MTFSELPPTYLCDMSDQAYFAWSVKPFGLQR